MKMMGYYLNGETSRRFSAYLEVSSIARTIVTLYVDDTNFSERIELEFSDLKIESRLGNTPREISFGNGQLFITEDNDAVDELMDSNSETNFASLLHKMESKLTLVVLASVLTIGFVWIFVVYGIPASAKIIAEKIPTIASEKLGSSLDILDQSIFEPSKIEEARQQEIQQLVAPYIAKHNYLNPRLEFRSGMKANALALPGGEIVFTDDFVELAENDEELLAVFFHELGHLKHRHITRRILQDSMITLMVIFITGDVETVDLVTGIPTLILDLSYSREFEIEADSYALELMHEEKIPLEHFASIMHRLEQFYVKKESKEAVDNSETDADFKIPDFLSTHPATKERIELTKKYIARYEKGLEIN